MKEMSRARRNELYWFAKQYPEWIEELNSLTDIPSSLESCKRGSEVNDPVGRIVERIDILKSKITLVEKSAELSGNGDLFLSVLNELKD